MLQKLRVCFVYTVLLTLVSTYAFSGTVEDHAPIGVMADHYHKQGEWMTSYRYMKMDMPDNYSSTNKQSTDMVNSQFMVAPTEMSMEMHMVGLMYGVTDQITAMLMVPYVKKKMSHRRRDNVRFETTAEGIADVKLSGLFSLKELVNLPIHFNFGVSFPTGSIDEKGDTPVGSDQDLPYPMQLGSGTFGILPGFTYADTNDLWSWGFQQGAQIQLGKNDHDYQLGDRHELTGWIAYKWREWLSTSFRVKGSIWGNINGEDNRLNQAIVPTAQPKLRGGERVDLFGGINLLGHHGALLDHRLAFEIGYPVYQSLNGPQLGAGLQGTIGWQKAF